MARWLSEEAYTGPSTHGHAHEHPAHDHSQDGHDHPAHDPHSHAHDHHDVNRHDDHIRAFCFTVEEPIPEDVLAAWLEMLMSFPGSDILRVKGILNVEGSDRPIVMHGVQHIFHPPVSLPAWPSEDRRSRLIFITQDVDREMIENTFRAFRQVLPQARESTA